MTAWLVSIYFNGLRVSGAILSALRGIVGAGRAARYCRGVPGTGITRHAPTTCERQNPGDYRTPTTTNKGHQ